MNASPVPQPISLYVSGVFNARTRVVLQGVKQLAANAARFRAAAQTFLPGSAPTPEMYLNAISVTRGLSRLRPERVGAVRPSFRRALADGQFTHEAAHLALETSRRSFLFSNPPISTLKSHIR
jgi:hypothetical protein